MKKINNVFLALVSLILAASFFAACGDDDPATTSEGGGVTYKLTVQPVTIPQGGGQDVTYTLTASDDSSTAGINVMYVAPTTPNAPGVSGNRITTTTSTAKGEHTFTATATKDGKTVATASFTVTVRELASGEVIYILNVPNVSVKQGNTASITTSFTTIPANSSTDGISVTFDKGTAPASITVSGSTVSAAAAAPEGVYTFTATAKKGNDTVDVKTFTVTVTGTYTLSLNPATITVAHNDEGNSRYTLTGGTDVTFEIIPDSGNPTPEFTLTANTASNRLRFETGIVPSTVATGEYKFTINAKKDGETVASASLTVKITPSFSITPGQTSYQTQINAALSITYTLTASDDRSTNGISVGCFCTTDYDNCDLLGEGNWVTTTAPDALSITVPTGATAKVHGIKMQAEDENYNPLADCTFNITVTVP